MSKTRIAMVALICVLVSLAVGYWMGASRPVPATSPPRSVTSAEQVALPGLAGRVRDILLNPEVFDRTIDLTQLLSELGAESLGQVRDAYDGVFLDRGDLELVLFAEYWARFDPEAAYRWASSDWRAQHFMVTATIFRTWGRADPQTAIGVAAKNPEAMTRRANVGAVLAGWEESGKPGVLDYVRNVGYGPDRQLALSVIARRMVLRDGVEGATEWAEALSEDDTAFKLNAMRRIASAAAEVDPEAAAAWVERHLDGDYSKSLPQRVGTRWAKRDGPAAMRWLATLPEGNNRDAGVRETFLSWMRVDRHGAMGWVRSTEPARWLEPALSVFALEYGLGEPEDALVWARRITDQGLHDVTVAGIARYWLVTDEASAKVWLEQSGLPDKLRQKIVIIPKGIRLSAENAAARQKRREGIDRARAIR